MCTIFMQINSILFLYLVVENRRDKEYNNCNYLEHPVRIKPIPTTL